MAKGKKRSLVSSEDDQASPPTPRTEKKPRRKIVSSSDDDVPHGVDYDAVEVGPVPAHEDVVQCLSPSDAADAYQKLEKSKPSEEKPQKLPKR